MCLIVCVVFLRVCLLVCFALVNRLQQGDAALPPVYASIPVSVIIPMFNESMVIAQTLEALSEIAHPNMEILVVDDGSKDGSSAIVQEYTQRDGRIRLISQQPNQGKSAALNIGFEQASHEVIITIDADTLVTENTVHQLSLALSDPAIAAAACNITIKNVENTLTRWQALEYAVALSLERRTQHQWGTITTVPGAASAWRKSAVLDAGGFSSDTLTEDADLSLTLLRTGARIVYLPHARVRTIAPVYWSSLFKQRRRWIYGNLQCAWKHKGGLVDGSPLALKLLGLPNFWFSHVFSFALFFLTIGYLPRSTHWLDPVELTGLIASIVIVDTAVCALALWIDRGDPKMLLDAPLQRLAFPFFLTFTFCTVCLSRLLNRPIRWDSIRRPVLR